MSPSFPHPKNPFDDGKENRKTYIIPANNTIRKLQHPDGDQKGHEGVEQLDALRRARHVAVPDRGEDFRRGAVWGECRGRRGGGGFAGAGGGGGGGCGGGVGLFGGCGCGCGRAGG